MFIDCTASPLHYPKIGHLEGSTTTALSFRQSLWNDINKRSSWEQWNALKLKNTKQIKNPVGRVKQINWKILSRDALNNLF